MRERKKAKRDLGVFGNRHPHTASPEPQISTMAPASIGHRIDTRESSETPKDGYFTIENSSPIIIALSVERSQTLDERTSEGAFHLIDHPREAHGYIRLRKSPVCTLSLWSMAPQHWHCI